MKSILDPSFRYVPSSATDVRKTFARVRSEMLGQTPPSAAGRNAEGARVLPLRRTQRSGVLR